MVLSMDSYFRDNPPTPEEIAKWRADLTRGWPYTEDDPEPDFFDWTPDPDRSATTDSIYLLKATGNWTEEDERVAFDPSKPPPRPLAELDKAAVPYVVYDTIAQKRQTPLNTL